MVLFCLAAVQFHCRDTPNHCSKHMFAVNGALFSANDTHMNGILCKRFLLNPGCLLVEAINEKTKLAELGFHTFIYFVYILTCSCFSINLIKMTTFDKINPNNIQINGDNNNTEI